MSHVVYGTNSRSSASVTEKTVILKSGATGDAAVFDRLNAAIPQRQNSGKRRNVRKASEKCPIHGKSMAKRPDECPDDDDDPDFQENSMTKPKPSPAMQAHQAHLTACQLCANNKFCPCGVGRDLLAVVLREMSDRDSKLVSRR